MTPEALSEKERRPVDLGALAKAARRAQQHTDPSVILRPAVSASVVLALVEAVRVAREALDTGVAVIDRLAPPSGVVPRPEADDG